jgi:valyl-tRNA synthetase
MVEPYLSDQWFVKMQPLVELARKAVLDKEVTFFPAKRMDDYLHWLDHTPDWCISRQIWWGHRIPIWYCRDCFKEIELTSEAEPVKIPGSARPILPESDDPSLRPSQCPDCKGGNLVQDPDVLDTWFSSQLWPLSTLGWPEETKDLAYYYPTSVLVTARDILALWVARMVMMGTKFRQKKPFSHVFIHGTIQDEQGEIMSKSRGNGFDPVLAIGGGDDHIQASQPLGEIPADRIEHYPMYGCDAVRYGIMTMASGEGQDIRITVRRTQLEDKTYDVQIPIFEEGKRFCNKIWQACHGVIFPNCKDAELETLPRWEGEPPACPRSERSEEQRGEPFTYLEDLWVSDRLHNIIQDCTATLQSYRIGEMCDLLYHFFWDDLCSWYLEVAKPRLWSEQGKESKICAQNTLLRALDTFLRLLHPVMPFITEELWQELRPTLAKKKENLPKACIIADWPVAEQFSPHSECRGVVELSREITAAINNIRAEYKVAPGQKIPQVLFTSNNAESLRSLQPTWEAVKRLSKVEKISAEPNLPKPERTAVRMVKDVVIYIPLEGLIDFEKEKKRLTKEIEKLQGQMERLEKKLNNPDYLAKAPANVAAEDRQRFTESQKQRERLQEELKGL